MPVATVFENLTTGATIDEIVEWFDISREQIQALAQDNNVEVVREATAALRKLSPR